MIRSIRRFMASEAAGGIVLALAAALALGAANTDLAPLYQRLVTLPIGAAGFEQSFVWWVNDLLMVAFFFVVGLEIKREVLAGELASRRRAMLPVVAALGGVVVPALIYAAINRADRIALRGWAIPTATDIAFALGVLSLLGRRAPVSLKVFLTAVAIIDDLAAIIVIAAFYTAGIAWPMLAGALAGAAVLAAMNRFGVRHPLAYVAVGLVVWAFVLGSGIHPTIAGVVTAMAVPLGPAGGAAGRGRGTAPTPSPLERTEHALHPYVAFAILPLFAFVNAGVALGGVDARTLAAGVPLGIALGLVLGKAIGVFGASVLLCRLTDAELPDRATRWQFFGVCLLCGIGFTMSLFIGGLAFEGQAAAYETQVKLGVLGGSAVAALAGVAVLLVSAPGRRSR